MYRQNRKVQRNKTKEPFNAVYPKIIKIGNSLGVVLRKFILDDIDWRRGDRVDFEYDPKEKVLKIRNYSAEQREYDSSASLRDKCPHGIETK